MPQPVVLDGASLSVAEVVRVARDRASVKLNQDALDRLTRARSFIDRAVAAGEVIYGVNTGFGKLAQVRIAPDQLKQLQTNLIRSHAARVGDPLPTEAVRGLMLLRTNVLLRETSGARPVVAERLVELLNRGIHPIVPEQGSVGACGDLAPLAHVALAMMGEGEIDGGTGGMP